LSIVVAVSALWTILKTIANVYALVSMNFNGGSLRGTTTSDVMKSSNGAATCPALPARLQALGTRPPARMLTREQIENQMTFIMKENKVGTTGNRVLVCPASRSSDKCQGVVKVYRSLAVCNHVKRCLKMLEHMAGDVGARLLYAGDNTKPNTMAEENMGPTMSISSWPDDYATQLRRIVCILRKHRIIHRDLNWQNFVVDETTGRIYVIDLGDAFVWQGGVWNLDNYKSRNLVNLFNIWWKHHDEQEQLDDLIAKIARLRKTANGNRIWKAPTMV
jgi:RIO-like serine/threonine protein kinase